MDYLVYPNAKFLTHFPSHNSKTKIKFMLYCSLVCVLFSLLPLFLHFFIQFFTYTVHKSYMFLLCNGLLVFIAMNSGLVNVSSPSTTHQSIHVAHDSEIRNQLELTVVSAIEAPVAGENNLETETPQEEEKNLMIVAHENVLLDTQEDEEEGNALMIMGEDDDHGHAAEDTEELNRKCEDFIRKMKAAFFSEPRADYTFYFDHQKSLVLVN